MELSNGLTAISSIAFAAVASRAGLLAAIFGAALPLLCNLLIGQARDTQHQLDAATNAYLSEQPKGWEKAVGDLAESGRRLERLSLLGTVLSLVAAVLGAVAALKVDAPRWEYLIGSSVVATVATLVTFWEVRRTYTAARDITMQARIEASRRAERKQFVDRMRSGQIAKPAEPPPALTPH